MTNIIDNWPIPERPLEPPDCWGEGAMRYWEWEQETERKENSDEGSTDKPVRRLQEEGVLLSGA